LLSREERIRDLGRVLPLVSPMFFNPLRAQAPLRAKDMRFHGIHSELFPLNRRTDSNRTDPAGLWLRMCTHTG